MMNGTNHIQDHNQNDFQGQLQQNSKLNFQNDEQTINNDNDKLSIINVNRKQCSNKKKQSIVQDSSSSNDSGDSDTNSFDSNSNYENESDSSEGSDKYDDIVIETSSQNSQNQFSVKPRISEKSNSSDDEVDNELNTKNFQNKRKKTSSISSSSSSSSEENDIFNSKNEQLKAKQNGNQSCIFDEEQKFSSEDMKNVFQSSKLKSQKPSYMFMNNLTQKCNDFDYDVDDYDSEIREPLQFKKFKEALDDNFGRFYDDYDDEEDDENRRQAKLNLFREELEDAEKDLLQYKYNQGFKNLKIGQMNTPNKNLQQQDDQFPIPRKDNLNKVLDYLLKMSSQMKKLIIQNKIKDSGKFTFINYLKELFQELEQKKENEGGNDQLGPTLTQSRLSQIGQIFKTLLVIGDIPIIETLLSNNFCNELFSALKYAPNVKLVNLLNKSQFKQIIDIDNPFILQKIHICFHASLLRDTIFAQEEMQIHTNLNQIILSGSLEILKYFLKTKSIIQEILTKQSQEITLEEKGQQVQFMLEIMQQIKNLTSLVNNQVINLGKKEIIDILTLNLSNICIFVYEMLNTDTRVIVQFKKIILNEQIDEIETEQKFQKMHNIYKGISYFDMIIVQSLDILQNIQILCNKEFLVFLLQNGRMLLKELAKHAFLSENQGIQLQIFDLFRLILDNSYTIDPKGLMQEKVEQLIGDTIFELFQGVIDGSDIPKVQYGVYLMFDYLQFMLKPQVFASFPGTLLDQRKGVTVCVITYLEKYSFIEFGFQLQSIQKVSSYVKLMALKFLKSACTDSEVLPKILKANPIDNLMPIILSIQPDFKSINLIQSVSLDFVNKLNQNLRQSHLFDELEKLQSDYKEILMPFSDLLKVFFESAKQPPAKKSNIPIIGSSFGNSGFIARKLQFCKNSEQNQYQSSLNKASKDQNASKILPQKRTFSMFSIATQTFSDELRDKYHLQYIFRSKSEEDYEEITDMNFLLQQRKQQLNEKQQRFKFIQNNADSVEESFTWSDDDLPDSKIEDEIKEEDFEFDSFQSGVLSYFQK